MTPSTKTHSCNVPARGGLPLVAAVFFLAAWAALGHGVEPTPPALYGPTSRPGPRFPPGHQPSDEGDDEAQSTNLRKLSREEIFRIRFLELRGLRMGKDSSPESITVKIDNKLVDEFLAFMEGDPAYTGEKNRGEFRKLTAAQKVHLIAAEKGPTFADKIHITSDPEVFLEFRKRVMPTVLQGCATSACHAPGGGENVKFELFKDPKKSAETTYANFIVLNDLRVGDAPLVNRSQAANSLLLTYMLPTKDVKPEMRHPGTVEYRPLFQTRSAPGFKRIENWITSLKHPSEDYGVHLIAPSRTPTTLPGDPGAPPP